MHARAIEGRRSKPHECRLADRSPLRPVYAWGMAAGTRLERIEARERNPKWKNAPLRIEMSECINCDACLRHCPSQFGAIFNHGADVVIVPELCSGCDKCLPACPVDCIYSDPEWSPGPVEWWDLPLSKLDPYK